MHRNSFPLQYGLKLLVPAAVGAKQNHHVGIPGRTHSAGLPIRHKKTFSQLFDFCGYGPCFCLLCLCAGSLVRLIHQNQFCIVAPFYGCFAPFIRSIFHPRSGSFPRLFLQTQFFWFFWFFWFLFFRMCFPQIRFVSRPFRIHCPRVQSRPFIVSNPSCLQAHYT